MIPLSVMIAETYLVSVTSKAGRQADDAVARIKRISTTYDLPIVIFGHAGDGNLHATPVKKPETPLDEWEEKLPALLGELYAQVRHLGGTISGEHGVGLTAAWIPAGGGEATARQWADLPRMLYPGESAPIAPAGEM